MPRLGSWVRIPSPAPKIPYFSETIVLGAANTFGKCRQNETRSPHVNMGKIRGLCSRKVLHNFSLRTVRDGLYLAKWMSN